MISFLSIISSVIRCSIQSDYEMSFIDTNAITLQQAKSIVTVYEHELSSFPSFFHLGCKYSADSIITGKISFLKTAVEENEKMIEIKKQQYEVSFSSNQTNSSNMFEKNVQLYKKEIKKPEDLLRWRQETDPQEQTAMINRFEMMYKNAIN